MRKLTIKTNNGDMYLSEWELYIQDKALNDMIRENMDAGTFKAKFTLIIEEIENDLIIEGNKTPEPEPEKEEYELED